MPRNRDAAVFHILSRRPERSVSSYGSTWMQMLKRISLRWADVEGFWMPFEVIADRARGEGAADKLAEFLGVDGGARCHRAIHGTGPTFTGEPSDWREWFGKQSRQSFLDQGGLRVLKRMGYKW